MTHPITNLANRVRELEAENQRLNAEVANLTSELVEFVDSEVSMRKLREKDAEALVTMRGEVEGARDDVRAQLAHDVFSNRDYSPEGRLEAQRVEIEHLRGLLKKVSPSHHASRDFRQSDAFMDYCKVEAVLPRSDTVMVEKAINPNTFEQMVSVVWRSKDPSKYGVVRHSLTPMWDLSVVDRRDQAQMLAEEIGRQVFQLLMEKT